MVVHREEWELFFFKERPLPGVLNLGSLISQSNTLPSELGLSGKEGDIDMPMEQHKYIFRRMVSVYAISFFFFFRLGWVG